MGGHAFKMKSPLTLEEALGVLKAMHEGEPLSLRKDALYQAIEAMEAICERIEAAEAAGLDIDEDGGVEPGEGPVPPQDDPAFI